MILGSTQNELCVLWDHSYEITNSTRGFHTFVPELQIVLLASHDVAQHQRTHQKDYRLYRTYDLHLLISRHNIDWFAVSRHAAHFRCQGHTIQALYQVAHLFGLPLEFSEVADLITGADEVRQYGLFTVNSSPFISTYRKIKIARKILTPSQFLSYLWERILFPPRDLMRINYQIEEDQPIWHYYIKRITGHTAKIFRSSLSFLTRKFRRPAPQ